MAIDTAAKRFSARNYALPWRGPAVIPDGTVAQSDRQALAYLYSGIAASGANIGHGRLEYVIAANLMDFTAPWSSLEFTIGKEAEEFVVNAP